MTGPNRRQFLALGGTAVAAIAVIKVGASASAATAQGCTDEACSMTTAWMLDPDWGYARGPHGKTRLVSNASRAAATNRIARSEADALDLNLHLCSWAPAVLVPVCATQLDAAFSGHARDWHNPWKDTTVSVVDKRWLPADFDLFACPASVPTRAPTDPGFDQIGRSGELVSTGTTREPVPTTRASLAFTGDGSRRLLFAGIGALIGGVVLRGLERTTKS